MTPINKIISIFILGIVLFSISFYLGGSFSNNEGDYIKLGGLSFHTSIEPGINEAKNQSKPIFLYFRSETCEWCILFEKETLSDNTIIELLNNDFILISIDTFKQKKAAQNFNVRTTPFIIFFNKDGQEISRIPGYIQKDEFLLKLKQI